MSDDPRIEVLYDYLEAASPYDVVDRLDDADRAVGIVRVDSRDDVAVEQIQTWLAEALSAWDVPADYAPDAYALLAYLKHGAW